MKLCPEVLDPEQLALVLEEFYARALLDAGQTLLDPEGKEHFSLALAAVEAARAHFILAAHHVWGGAGRERVLGEAGGR
jgi:hypothetical protein